MPTARHPLIFASWPTTAPTAPDAADTTTVSPTFGCPMSMRPTYAVMPGMPRTPMAVEIGGPFGSSFRKLLVARSRVILPAVVPGDQIARAETGIARLDHLADGVAAHDVADRQIRRVQRRVAHARTCTDRATDRSCAAPRLHRRQWNRQFRQFEVIEDGNPCGGSSIGFGDLRINLATSSASRTLESAADSRLSTPDYVVPAVARPLQNPRFVVDEQVAGLDESVGRLLAPWPGSRPATGSAPRSSGADRLPRRAPHASPETESTNRAATPARRAPRSPACGNSTRCTSRAAPRPRAAGCPRVRCRPRRPPAPAAAAACRRLRRPAR